MEYRENYMTAKRLAEKIRQSARGRRKGLAAKDEDQSYQPFEPGRYMSMVQQMFADDIGTDSISSYLDSDAPASSLRPVARDDEPTRPLSALEALSGDSGLNKDPEFMAAVEGLEEKYPGLDRREIFRVISGESGFNPQAVNKDTSAAGLFQFTPEAASDLGYSTEEILRKTLWGLCKLPLHLLKHVAVRMLSTKKAPKLGSKIPVGGLRATVLSLLTASIATIEAYNEESF